MYLNYYVKSKKMYYFFMNLNYECFLGYIYFQLVSTIIGQRKLTNSVSDKKEIHSPSQTKKNLHSECCAVLSYSYIELFFFTILLLFSKHI